MQLKFISVFAHVQIIEKCRYDEEADEWIIPFTKKRSLGDETDAGGGSKMFPDINQPSLGAGAGGALGNNAAGNKLPTVSNNALASMPNALRDPSRQINVSNGNNGGKNGVGNGSGNANANRNHSAEGSSRPLQVSLLNAAG